jgi:hypothetical protein
MERRDLHIAETAGWRALLTHAQIAGGVRVSPAAEEYMVSMLFRQVGAEISLIDPESGLLDRLNRMLTVDTVEPALIGDQCLLLCGLFPENAIREGIPVTYFVQVGRNAFREYASRHGSELHALLADEFVLAMDTLQTIRLLQSGKPCIDGFNAYHLWRDLGSSHGWRVLRGMTTGLPAGCGSSESIH